DHLDDVDPFLRVLVALLMVALPDPEHLELTLVPSHDDIQSETPLADMVGSDHLLGGNDRIEERRMHGTEYRDALGRGEQPRCPGDGLERCPLIVGVSPISFPAPDREQEVNAGSICHSCKLEIVRPAPGPALRNQSNRPP